jgi:hypothetical protein
VCVGGVTLDDGTGLRLLGSDGRNLPQDKPIYPGEIWDLTYNVSERIEPPHVEDVVVARGRPVGRVDDVKARLLSLVTPWEGAVESVFESSLTTTDHGHAYLAPSGPIPPCSTGFWVADHDVRLSQFEEHGLYYWFPEGRNIRSVKYVGMKDPIDVIPEGSLIRFSLARWWGFPPGEGERRCYLQLSGWFE